MLFIQFWMFSKDFSSVMSYTRMMPWRRARGGDKETGHKDSVKVSEWAQRGSDAKLIIQSACSAGILCSPWLLCSRPLWWSWTSPAPLCPCTKHIFVKKQKKRKKCCFVIHKCSQKRGEVKNAVCCGSLPVSRYITVWKLFQTVTVSKPLMFSIVLLLWDEQRWQKIHTFCTKVEV